MKSILLTLLAVPFLALSVQAEDAKPAAPTPPAAPASPAPPAVPDQGGKPKMDPAAAFAKLDTNADKTLSLDEFKASPRFKKDASKADGAFKRMNKSGDGKMTLEEFSAKPERPKKPGKDGEPKKP